MKNGTVGERVQASLNLWSCTTIQLFLINHLKFLDQVEHLNKILLGYDDSAASSKAIKKYDRRRLSKTLVSQYSMKLAKNLQALEMGFNKSCGTFHVVLDFSRKILVSFTACF